VAESFVFVYIGMALPTLHFTPAIARLGVTALAACFLGRWHVFALSALTDAAGRRTRLTSPPRIELSHMMVMWLAGLRGGVAFAIASASMRRLDFPARCGGRPDGAAGDPACQDHLDFRNDSDAILHVST
jgi:NhaP-type Na+/H+ or K+/H+ antiporter